MKSIFVITLLSLSVTSASAGGSISREDALKEICAKSAAVCSVLPQLSDVGTAVRARSGERLMPFVFSAKTPNGSIVQVEISQGEDGKLVLTLKD